MRIKPRSHSIEYSCKMFTEICPIGAGTIEMDFFWLGKESGFQVGHDGHDFFRKLAAQEFEERAYFACTLFFNRFPVFGRNRINMNMGIIKFTPTDKGLDFAFAYFEINNRAITRISSSTWKATFIVTIRFKIITPSFAPEGGSNTTSFDLNRF